MKDWPQPLIDHLAGRNVTVCYAVAITRTDSQVIRMADHDRDLTVAGQTYRAAPGFVSSNVKSSRELRVDNLDLQGSYDSAGITRADLLAGRYRSASFALYIVNYVDPTQYGILLTGRLGRPTIKDYTYEIELRSLSQLLQQEVGPIYSTRCRAQLGHGKCALGVNLATYTKTGTVAAATSQKDFTSTDISGITVSNWFDHEGVLTWTSGLNAGLEMEVNAHTYAAGTHSFTLLYEMPFAIQAGDGFSVHAGCDKSLEMCRDKFNNVRYRQAEDYVPIQEILTAPNAQG